MGDVQISVDPYIPIDSNLLLIDNTGLGKLGDSIEGLERAILYLKRAEDRHLDT